MKLTITIETDKDYITNKEIINVINVGVLHIKEELKIRKWKYPEKAWKLRESFGNWIKDKDIIGNVTILKE
jgi:hypothetical protein